LDRGALVLEFLALIALVISLGSVARVWLSGWGALLAAVVLAGILFPLALHTRSHLLGRLSVPAGAVLVLLGGFLMRMVIVLSSEGV
jgi:protein NrfD